MISRAHAYKLRALIEATSSNLSDTDALSGIELFPKWQPDVSYVADERVRYNDKLYRVIQNHTSQADWTPDVTAALFTEVALPGEIPVWKQPTGSHDAYQIDDKVHYPDAAGPVYISTVNNNTWAPDVYGWQLV